jgi:hypothetical protein
MALNSVKDGCSCAVGYEVIDGRCISIATKSIKTSEDFGFMGITSNSVNVVTIK